MTISSLQPAARVAPQTAQHVMMIRPAAFGFNPETAASNRFQQNAGAASDAANTAIDEFDAAVRALRSEGVQVCVIEDAPEPKRPDAVFPNNWVSFHRDGTVVLYPMESPTRRRERRRDAVEQLCRATGFQITRWVDLSPHENRGAYLEGTGSLVLDHVGRVAYAARSSRTHESVVQDWCAQLGYAAELFDAADRDGAPIYHTNVLMSIGSGFAVVAADVVAPVDRERVLRRLTSSGRAVLTIDESEMRAFCGNVLELAAWDESLGDCSVLAMSASARRGFAATTMAKLAACVDNVLAIPIPTIERLGGGSIRCMIAEVFAP
jgi:hypothetical protein